MQLQVTLCVMLHGVGAMIFSLLVTTIASRCGMQESLEHLEHHWQVTWGTRPASEVCNDLLIKTFASVFIDSFVFHRLDSTSAQVKKLKKLYVLQLYSPL